MNNQEEKATNFIIGAALLALLIWCLYNYFELDAYRTFTGKSTVELEQMLADGNCKSGTCELVVRVEDKHIKCGGDCCRD